MDAATSFNSKVLQLAIIRVKPGRHADVDDVRTRTPAILGKMKGFAGYVPMTSMESDALLVDHMLWDTLEDAKALAEEFERTPEARKLADGVEELILFDHFQPAR